MKTVDEIKHDLGEEWIPDIYADKIRTQRTRSHDLKIPRTENHASILHTLLGIELKVKNRRFPCPDLSTARYLRLFARIGIREFAIPYDISRISTVADELESSWHRMILILEKKCTGKSPQIRGKIRAQLIRQVRNEIDLIGPGELMPEFDTKAVQKNG